MGENPWALASSVPGFCDGAQGALPESLPARIRRLADELNKAFSEASLAGMRVEAIWVEGKVGKFYAPSAQKEVRWLAGGLEITGIWQAVK